MVGARPVTSGGADGIGLPAAVNSTARCENGVTLTFGVQLAEGTERAEYLLQHPASRPRCR